MKSTKKLLTSAACGLLLMAAGAQAATVQVDWSDTGQFRDIRATDMNQGRFEERVMKELEEQFRREAAKLPADQTLHISVQDVDLAGEIEYFHRNYPFGLRVIRRVDSPSMQLSYELRDANDRVISSGDERLRDMNFRFSNLIPADRSVLRYEKDLIKDWYSQSF